PDVDRLHCFLDSQLAPGHIGWLFTGVRGIAQLGLAARLPTQPDLDALVGRIRSRFDFRLAVRVERRGGLIPVGGPVRRWHAPGVVLVGDAAGLVSPLTAGGIHLALASGEAAAHAIADHLLRGAPDPARVLAPARPAFAVKRWLRAAMDLRPPNALLDATLRSPATEIVAREILFHRLRRRSPEAHRLSVLSGG
ncbi:MAG TPA: hypothetical protein VJM11_18000, partial [Nevskiaceae bacterium]|nr:hypothetical protein [Nevskiaceae bacterium]